MTIEITDIQILIVDDDYSNVEVITSVIRDEVREVLYASDGAMALKLVQEYIPDIIIMDWDMPGMSGLDAIRELKCIPEVRDIPVIVVTGVKTSTENLSAAFDAGAIDFLKKPFDGIELRARIKSALKIKWQHDMIEKMLKESVEQKQRELMSIATLDYQRKTLLDELLKQVERLNKITNFVYATDIIGIQKQLKNQLGLDRSWDNFKVHLEEVHGSFFEKLDSHVDNISLSERKLAAYIKLGMSNYEISKVTDRSNEAIKKAVHRLKKKLGLSASDDIRQFMINF